jgi:hypothetical protein
VTAPSDSELATHPGGRPRKPVASGVVILAAFLVGAGALAVSSVLQSDLLRLGIAVVLVLGGWLVSRPGRDPEHPASLAIGVHVLRGVGTAYIVLGAYLGGLALLTAAIPDGPVFPGESVGPSPTVVVLMVYGVPTLALLAVATTGIRAWTAGAGAALPMITVLLMAGAGASTAAVAISMLVVGVVLAVVVIRTRGRWADLAAAAAAMATSFAFGAGSSPFGTLGTTQLAGTPETGPSGQIPAGALTAVLAGALLVASVLVLVAVLRRDLAGGVLAGAILAMPPVLLSTWVPPGARWPTEAIVALAGVPAAVAVIAMVAIRIPRVRKAIAGALPSEEDTEGDDETAGSRSDAIATAGCAVVVAAAAVAFVVLALPVLGWAQWAQGAVALVVLFGAAALGYWLPKTPGAAGSVVALLGLGLASPWARLLAGSWMGASQADRIITGVLDLGAAAALAWFLTRRHPHPGVYAAAAYTLAGSTAAFLGSLMFDAGSLATGASPFSGPLAPVTIVALPLILLGIGAVVATARGRIRTGQAVGAVAVAAAGFVPLKVLVGQFTGGSAQGYALQFALNPLTPTDWLQTSMVFRDVTGPARVAILAMVVLALVLATSLVTRPSAPLAGAVALLLLAAVQSTLLTVLSSGTTDDAQLLGQVLGGLAAVVAVIAIAAGVNAARRT